MPENMGNITAENSVEYALIQYYFFKWSFRDSSLHDICFPGGMAVCIIIVIITINHN